MSVGSGIVPRRNTFGKSLSYLTDGEYCDIVISCKKTKDVYISDRIQ